MGKSSVKLVDDFPDFAGNKRLHWIAEEWLRYSDRLAEWTMEHLVNRRDVWSQYIVKNGEVGVVMLPVKERRKSGAEMVTMNKLRRHFSGRAISHLIGLHSISDHSTCKWFAIDIDLHDETVADADEVAVNNLAAGAGERMLITRYPNHRKLWRTLGWVERISDAQVENVKEMGRTFP